MVKYHEPSNELLDTKEVWLKPLLSGIVQTYSSLLQKMGDYDNRLSTVERTIFDLQQRTQTNSTNIEKSLQLVAQELSLVREQYLCDWNQQVVKPYVNQPICQNVYLAPNNVPNNLEEELDEINFQEPIEADSNSERVHNTISSNTVPDSNNQPRRKRKLI